MFRLAVATLFTLLLAVVSNALPAGANNLIVFNPRITAPKSASTWRAGSKNLVTWDTSRIPKERWNSTGLILLGHSASGNYDNENLDIDHPLASGFPINSGRVNVTVPSKVQPRDDYFVVLFGDSGNRSPAFKIRA